MAQLTIYIPDELEARVRERARSEGKSLSAFVSEAVRNAVEPAGAWSQAFLDLYGAWEGALEEPDDPPAEPADPL